jgi:hypothetical protein
MDMAASEDEAVLPYVDPGEYALAFSKPTAAGSVLPMLPVRLGLRRITDHFLAP